MNRKSVVVTAPWDPFIKTAHLVVMLITFVAAKYGPSTAVKGLNKFLDVAWQWFKKA